MGGAQNTPQVARILRIAGLVFPVILTGYGYLMLAGVVENDHFSSFHVLVIISYLWTILSLWQFFSPAKNSLVALFRLGAYHALSACYLLFVSGVMMPFVVFWLILLVASFMYFGRRGALLSMATFTLVVLLDIAIYQKATPEIIVYAVVALVSLAATGIALLNINRAQSVDRQELARSHAQEKLQRDRILAIVNNLADAVLSVDKNGVIKVYNAAALSLLDTNDSLNGHHIDTVLPLEERDGSALQVSDILKTLSSSSVRDDVWYRLDEAEAVRLELTVSPIRKAFRNKTANQEGYILILRDITKIKSLEEERDEFISVVSHELRTPVTVAEGSLSNLKIMLERDDISKDKMNEAVDMAHQQTVYLARMINDLSALSRAERGVADEAEIIDVGELIGDMFATYQPEASSKGLVLNIDTSARLTKVKVSRLYLEELLQNFITNAIKYTKEGSVTICARERSGNIHFAVKDTGIGISRADQKKVFEKFYRSEDYRTRETGGTGLGLYVVTKLAKKLNTRVELTSRLNHGSSFSFSLPVYKENK